MLKYLSNYNNKYSISFYYRKKRFKIFYDLLKEKSGCKILDVGGFENSLEILDKGFCDNNEITILNIENVELLNKKFKFVLGDATDPGLFPEKSFDIIYCNSVIEHAGDSEQRKILSDNIRKWSHNYFVQTPNFYFPMEPHFLMPFFQFLPIKLRAYLLNRFSLGYFSKEKNYEDALKIVTSVRLLKKKELLRIFPGAKILKERFLFFTKSLIAHNFD